MMNARKGSLRSARPFLLRVLPDRLRISTWARLYRGQHSRNSHLYEAAPLRFAPEIWMRLLPGDVISDSIAFTGIYELELTRRLCDLATRGGLLIDVGANLGYFAMLWSAARADNRCMAFEASPRNIGVLQRNITFNELDQQVRLIPCAAGALRGSLTFDVGSPDQTGWGGFSNAKNETSIQVDVVRIDDIVKSSEPIALLKVDTEGADTWVLRGCEQLLRARTIREIWYEQNKPRMKALEIPLDAAQSYLRNLGYIVSPEGDPRSEVVEWRAVSA